MWGDYQLCILIATPIKTLLKYPIFSANFLWYMKAAICPAVLEGRKMRVKYWFIRALTEAQLAAKRDPQTCVLPAGPSCNFFIRFLPLSSILISFSFSPSPSSRLSLFPARFRVRYRSLLPDLRRPPPVP